MVFPPSIKKFVSYGSAKRWWKQLAVPEWRSHKHRTLSTHFVKKQIAPGTIVWKLYAFFCVRLNKNLHEPISSNFCRYLTRHLTAAGVTSLTIVLSLWHFVLCHASFKLVRVFFIRLHRWDTEKIDCFFYFFLYVVQLFGLETFECCFFQISGSTGVLIWYSRVLQFKIDIKIPQSLRKKSASFQIGMG